MVFMVTPWLTYSISSGHSNLSMFVLLVRILYLLYQFLLILRAGRWREVEKEAKHQLVVYCGGVIVNEKGDPFLKDVVDAAKKFKLR